MASGPELAEVRPRLFLGSGADAAQIKELARLRFTHVLSVGSEFPAKLGVDEKQREKRRVEGRSCGGRLYLQEGGKKDPFVRLCVSVEDEDDEDLAEHLDECRLFISEGLAQGKVLVHCADGRSRGVAVVVSFLMQREKASLGKALLSVKEKRPSASPRGCLLSQLRGLEERLALAPASPRTAEAAGLVARPSGGERANPQVFLEISIEAQPAGRVVVELFADIVPETVENFRCLCTGEKGRGASGKRLTYLGSIFHRIIPGFVCVAGDFTMGDGTGGESIFGSDFKDESFEVKHTERGVLSMANSGPNTNGSQFLICLKECPELDGKNVAFGKIVSGAGVLEQVEACGGEGGEPTKRVTILDCGEVSQPGRKVKRARPAAGDVFQVLHILRKHSGVKKPSSWRAESVSCSREEASDQLAELRRPLSRLNGAELQAKFRELAARESDCKSAKKGGDLGPFERGLMKKDFEAAALALEVGELSGVVSCKDGEHLILRVK